MKAYAHYDLTGRIRGLVVFDASDRYSAGISPKRGDFVAEVEGLKISGSIRDLDTLREIARSYKVANPATRCALEKKK
jgi:hypothetical protein